MKSEKVSAYLMDWSFKSMGPEQGRFVRYYKAICCIEMAEEEAEDRVRRELTKWNDPTVSLPEVDKEVLLKMERKDGTNHYVVGWLSEKGRFTTSIPFLLSEIEGWRYILDNPEMLKK